MEEIMTSRRMEFARYIKAMRERKGLSKFKASVALGYKSDGVINQVEQGRAPLPIERIHPVAHLSEIDPDDLLKKIEECEPELFRKYKLLEGHILGRFMRNAMQLRGSDLGPDGERIARHHALFPTEGGASSVYYVNLSKIDSSLEFLIPSQYYQMEQMKLKFPTRESAEPRISAKILPFQPAADAAISLSTLTVQGGMPWE